MEGTPSGMTGIVISDAQSVPDFLEARQLFEEYAESIGVDLCFQNFDRELETLNQMYAPPRGYLLLARRDGATVGCIALRPFKDEVCEMKRLYIRPLARGKRIGVDLARIVVARARESGYKRMVLDTLESMEPARRIYRSLGFRWTGPYYENPIESAVYMELDLGGKHGSDAFPQIAS
jgi:ribosomal protein S18 acetylase RimI-like enzyme